MTSKNLLHSALLSTGFALLAQGAAGIAPVGTLYFTQDGPYPGTYQTRVGKLQGPSFFGTIMNVQAVMSVNPNEGPIAVAGGDIRTYTNNMYGMSPGSRYDLNLNSLGQSYAPWQLTPFNSLNDGTTDGFFNYSVEGNGIIVRTDRDWQNPVRMNVPGLNGFWGMTGITWDFNTNSLWMSGFYSGGGYALVNTTKSGSVLQHYSVPHWYRGLAMDVDGTLWGSTHLGHLHHMTTGGAYLGVVGVLGWGNSSTGAPSGIEIEVAAVPEPTSVAMLAVGAMGLLVRRRRRG